MNVEIDYSFSRGCAASIGDEIDDIRAFDDIEHFQLCFFVAGGEEGVR
jgi:hypothetical protein